MQRLKLPLKSLCLLPQADLSQNDRNMIAKHTLKGALDHLRDALENVEQSYKCNPTPNELTDDQGPQKAISRLLAALLGHEVVLELHSRTGNGRCDLRASS